MNADSMNKTTGEAAREIPRLGETFQKQRAAEASVMGGDSSSRSGGGTCARLQKALLASNQLSPSSSGVLMQKYL